MSLLLEPQIPSHKDIPQEYNMNLTNRKSSNTFVFSEKDLHGYSTKSKIGMPGRAAGGPYPSRAPNSAFQQRSRQNAPNREAGKRWQPYKRTIPSQSKCRGTERLSQLITFCRTNRSYWPSPNRSQLFPCGEHCVSACYGRKSKTGFG